MLINIALVVFLIFVTYWWSQQGLFSGLMHLISVIIAGSLAFALWEPLSMMLIGWASAGRFAWGLALIVPFVFWLLVIRVAYDTLVKANMHFHAYMDLGGGAFFGLMAAMLTAGIFMLGVSFMGVGQAFGGYQPLALSASGQIEPNDSGKLWVGVDGMAAGFFTSLSGGVFAPFNGMPMSEYQPQLAMQAGLFRMSQDPGASPVIAPGTVKVTDVVDVPTPVEGLTIPQRRALGDALNVAGSRAVFVMTSWTQQFPTYDQDSTLRVSPSQIRLAARVETDPSAEVELHAPVAGNRSGGPTAEMDLHAFDNDATFLSGVDNEDRMGWLFVIPADAKPQFLLVRHTRLALSAEPQTEKPALIASLGSATAKPKAASASGGGGTSSGAMGGRQGFRTGSAGVEISVSNELPMSISRNKLRGSLKISGDNKIVEGQGEADWPEGGRSTKMAVNEISAPGHTRIVRVMLGSDRAQSLLGMSMSAAASLAQPLLHDERGNTIPAFGYVWARDDRSQKIWIDHIRKIKSTRDLPVRQMGSSDSIALYFQVPKGRKIVQYSVGQTTQDVDLAVN